MDVFDLFARISLDTSDYTGALNSASAMTASFGDKLKSGLATAAKVGAAAIGAATTAATAFAATSVKTGMDFDAAMSQISATMGMTTQDIKNNVDGAGDTFDLLRQKALEMGSSTNYTATQAAEGLNILAMSGYDATQSMDMIEDVLHLAAAGSMDMASAAGFVSGAMKGFSDETKNSAYYADLMAKGATLANTDVTQLGAALSDAAATSKTYGQSADSTTLALLRLAEQGQVGTAASTALAAAMKNLYAPTNQAKKVMQELGVNAFDPASGSARDFNVVVNELQDALSGYTDEQRTAYAQTIFGIQGFDAYNKMIVTSVEKQNEWTAALEESTGEAAKQYDTMTDNLLGDVDKWNSALEGFQLVLSDQLTPTVRQFVQFGTDAISTLSTAFKDGGLSGAMDALGTILSDGLNMVIEQLPKFVDAGMQLLGALAEGLLSNSDKIIDSAIEIVTILVEGVVSGAPKFAESAVQLISELANGIGEAAPDLIPAAEEAIIKFVQGLTNPESLKNLIDAAVNLISGIIEGLVRGQALLLEYAPEIVVNLVTGIISALPKIVEVGGQLILGLIQGLVQGIAAIPEAVSRIAMAVINGFKEIFGIHSPSTVMADIGGNLINGLVQGVSNTFKSVAGTFSQIGKSIIDGIKSGISSAWSNLTSWVSGLFGGLVKSVKSMLGIASPSKVFAGIGSNMALGLEEGWDNEFGGIKRQIENGLNFGTANVGITASGTYNTSRNAQDGAQTAFNGAGGTTVNIYSPVAVDAVQAAKEWKKTTQRMAMSYI